MKFYRVEMNIESGINLPLKYKKYKIGIRIGGM
jgi:hypothetical protein